MSRAARLAAVLAVAGAGLVVPLGAAGSAVEVPTCFGKPATIVGTDEPDTIQGTPGDDVIVSGKHHDVIHANGGDDLICAGGSRDLVFDGPGRDKVDGGAAPDIFVAGPGDDLLDGGSDEPEEANLVSYENAESAVTVDLAADEATGVDFHDVVRHVGSAVGGVYDDVLLGGPERNGFSGDCGGDDVIRGRGGQDLLYVRDFWRLNCPADDNGHDRFLGQGDTDVFEGGPAGRPGTNDLRGGAGPDWFRTQGGHEDIHGGRGTDLFGISPDFLPENGLHMDLAEGTYSIGDGQAHVRGVERVGGTHNDDVIKGDAGNNVLVGGAGDDVLRGRAGDDVLNGRGYYGTAPGQDTVYGGPGTDECYAARKFSCEKP